MQLKINCMGDLLKFRLQPCSYNLIARLLRNFYRLNCMANIIQIVAVY